MSTKWTKERRLAHGLKIRRAFAKKRTVVAANTEAFGTAQLKAEGAAIKYDQMLGDESLGTIEAITLLIQYRDGSLEAKRVI